MGQEETKIQCYADDAVLLAENEDDLQRLLHQFNMTAKKIQHEGITTNNKICGCFQRASQMQTCGCRKHNRANNGN